MRRLLIAAGAIAMVAGLIGAVADPDAGAGALLFLVAVLVLHDGVVQPLVSLTVVATTAIGKKMVSHRRARRK